MPLRKLFRQAEFEETQQRFERRQESRESGPAQHDDSNWLVSYADMMTLLCGFFIMLFTMAKLDEPQYERLKQEVATHFKGKYQNPNEGLGLFASRMIQEAGLNEETTIVVDTRGVVITFQSRIFFEPSSAEVKPQGRAALIKIVDAIFSQQMMAKRNYRIVVEGHTDSRPISAGDYPSNWELSSARSAKVIRLFQEKGFPSDRLTAIGYADTRPMRTERKPDGSLDEAAMALNRRVVLRILEPKVDSIPITSEAAAHVEAADAPPPANPAH